MKEIGRKNSILTSRNLNVSLIAVLRASTYAFATNSIAYRFLNVIEEQSVISREKFKVT